MQPLRAGRSRTGSTACPYPPRAHRQHRRSQLHPGKTQARPPGTKGGAGKDTLPPSHLKPMTTSFQPTDELKALQERKLRELLEYVARHSPFYRELFAIHHIDI